MLILFDNGTPRGIPASLRDHTVREARALGWDALGNGELLKSAEAAGFDLLLTTDTNIAYQKNLEGHKIAIVVLGKGRWRLIQAHATAGCRGPECGEARNLHRS